MEKGTFQHSKETTVKHYKRFSGAPTEKSTEMGGNNQAFVFRRGWFILGARLFVLAVKFD